MDWNLILSQVITAVLIALLPPLAVAAIRFLWAQGKLVWEKAKTWNPAVTALIEQAAQFAVIAAEQAGAAKLITDRKAYALKVAEAWLAERGLTIDLDLLDAAIEKAVYDEFKSDKPRLPALPR
jgi:hypothetical protein